MLFFVTQHVQMCGTGFSGQICSFPLRSQGFQTRRPAQTLACDSPVSLALSVTPQTAPGFTFTCPVHRGYTERRVHPQEKLRHELIIYDSVADIHDASTRGEIFVFFSHQWLGWSEPDPQRIHFAAMQQAVHNVSKDTETPLEKIRVYASSRLSMANIFGSSRSSQSSVFGSVDAPAPAEPSDRPRLARSLTWRATPPGLPRKLSSSQV